MACSTMTSAMIFRVTSALQEGGRKAERTLCSLEKSIKFKSHHLACLARRTRSANLLPEGGG